MNPEILQTIEIIFLLAIAVILHEVAHGWVALKCGDPTAKLLGRLTLNPLKHIDPIGTILLPIMTMLIFKFPFAAAKPVPVNFMNLRHPKRDMILVAAAGPAVNIVLALIASVLFPLSDNIFGLAVKINLGLAFFNLIPIPPLDGSRIVAGLLPNSLARQYMYLEPFGIFIVIFLLQVNALDFVYIFVMKLAAVLIGNLSF